MSCNQKYPADRSLESLDPRYRARFEDYLEALRRTFTQFQIIVTETRRSAERQACLRASGASKTDRSNHQDGVAMDIAIKRLATGQLDWRPAVFRNMYRILDPRDYGLTTGSHLWAWDEGHIQVVEVQGEGKKSLGPQEKYEH